MPEPTDTAARRPLKTRGAAWVAPFTRSLVRIGLRPNGVSLLSILFSALGGVALITAHKYVGEWWPFAIAALCIQLRLLCNMMDGLLAVEGGFGSPLGDLYNEAPDRISDILLLAAAGYAATHSWGSSLGWAAACGALLTAATRMHGASLTGHHEFCGPAAKPHRMFILTVACLAKIVLVATEKNLDIITIALSVIIIGSIITFFRRLTRTAKRLRA